MILAGLLALFDAQTLDEEQLERRRCYENLPCRILIDDRPPQLMEAASATENCAGNASTAFDRLTGMGLRPQIKTVKLRGQDHAFVQVQIDGTDWVVDNGALPFCGRACKLNEAMHGLPQK